MHQLKSKPYVRTQAAADHLGLSPSTLTKWRVTGKGPRFRSFGRVVAYTIEDLDAWAETRTRRSTSDPGARERSEAMASRHRTVREPT